MRILIWFVSLLAIISVVFKWRYKILNALLAFSFLRRITVALTMNMPTIRNKLLPNLFNSQSQI
ncbi:hypothetical protein [Oceanobacillus halotolerans]|uniref:hypothetical protein n=1 Tax=Oceanobacillus halotolerans TaxID=2663380 RepID=UPI0013DD46A4|nr:hypothetical protein [Oceanobacillus halotolerans]